MSPSSSLERTLHDVVTALEGEGIPFALVGGLAVSVRTEPRFTRDVDLAVSVDSDLSAEHLVHTWLRRGWRVLSQVEHEETGRLATVRLLPPSGEGVVVDLLFASSGIEREIVRDAETLEVFEDLTVPVAAAHHLLATKILSMEPARPQDRIDALALLARLDPSSLEAARAALRSIEERRYHRGKDLEAELASLLEEGSAGRP